MAKYREKNRERLRELRANWTARNRDSIRQKQKEYRENNREKVKNAMLQWLYGISYEQFRELHRKQAGLCAACRCPVPLESAYVDHCHVTKKVRGLLHSKCNVGIGMFDDNPDKLTKAAKYLKRKYS